MDPYTLNRGFVRQNLIDQFSSLIWTERYYGDSEVELVVPATREMFQKLPVGTFLSIEESDEVMILESMTIEEGKLKLTGISLLPWMDNRFVRTSSNHEDQYWYIENQVPGAILWIILYNMCVTGSPYLNGSINTGISNPQSLAIPGLSLREYDKSGSVVKVGIPFGPVYSAMKEIATAYEIGMQILLGAVSDTSYSLLFRSYKGLDRSSGQAVLPVVRFSPQMDSFTNIKELQSIKEFKTLVYSFATGLNPGEGDPVLTTVPGKASLTGTQYTGFDLRAIQIFASDITTDLVGGSQAKVVDMLNSRARDELVKDKFIKTVDGEIVPESQFKYGVHYNLGDLIEVEGNTGVVQLARITEYIRSQDESGEKAYPTVSIVE